MLMRRLGRLVMHHRRVVLGVSAIIVVVSAAYGATVKDSLTAGGFVVTGSQSQRAEQLLDRTFHTGTPNILFIVTAKEGTVDSSDVTARGIALTKKLAAEPKVAEAMSYWTLNRAAPLRGAHGTQALVVVRIQGNEDAITAAAEYLHPRYTASDDVVKIDMGGPGEIFRAITAQADKDLVRAELLSLPVTLVLLLVIFGSGVAASLPLGVGVVAIVVTFAVLRLLTLFTDVSIFSLSITTGMGLGLAVDYSLFILSRYREELARDADISASLLRTMHTAGRTVAFSALSVGVALATLLVFPLPFLRSFSYAGVACVAVAGIVSVVVLPAVLAALGDRVNKLKIPRLGKQREHRFWYHQGVRVMRHPVVVSLAVVTLLVLLGLPFLKVNLGLADDRVLAPGTPVRVVHDALRSQFPTKEAGAISVVAPDVPAGPDRQRLVDGYAKQLSTLTGVARVDAKTGFYIGGKGAPPAALSSRFATPDAVWFSVVPSIEPLSSDGEDLVKRVRDAPHPFPVLVGGVTAQLVDTKATVFAKIPLALVLLNVGTFVLMFLMVGSLLVPLKSIILNVFSISATFGAVVWIFQDGHLSGFLGFTPTGTIPVFIPIAVFCIAFGLSQDYEVFLLSRIKEHYDLTRDNEESVATGLQLSGRIISALAILLIITFVAFGTAQVAVVKLFGISLAISIVVDAFIIRVTLAPALLRIAGHLNWWAPRALRRLHLRFGIWETEALDLFDTTAAPASANGDGPATTGPTTHKRKSSAKSSSAKRSPGKKKPTVRKSAPRKPGSRKR